ncbi:MAG TPA: glycerol-3-phosphate dehydrogenase [Xanthobacteraceae bacterium]|nr:glycerol-3-phosphate dehydrogenase [Xanthobacteraceae bacterium]
MADFDLAIIGGGITGTGIAREAAGRGLRVLLVEQHDLAAGSSSASSKVFHGGLTHFTPHEVRRLRQAQYESAMVLRLAPHLVRPLRFVLPHHPALPPAWRLRLNLFVADRLARPQILPGTRTLDLIHGTIAAPLQRRYRLGFEWSGYQIDDSRLVVLNAVDAAERGAVIRTRTRLVRAEGEDREWRLSLKVRGGRDRVTARVVVNASGPWAAGVAERVLRRPLRGPVPLLKGSHIVVRRRFGHDRAYLFASEDRRAGFAIPYEHDFTLIGTTQEAHPAEPDVVLPGPDGIAALCAATREFLREPITTDEIVWAFAGLQALHPSGRRTARVWLDAAAGSAPLLTVYGGALMSYRGLAERALAQIADYFVAGSTWTGTAPLPGGDFAWDGIEALVARTRARWPFLNEAHARRWVSAYGTRLECIVEGARRLEDLGPSFGADLTAAEIRYLQRHEWAQTAEDVLWRRSKLGLHVRPEQQAALERFMATDVGLMTQGSPNGDNCHD